MAKRRVVVVGGGFGGLTLAQELAGADVSVTLVDRTNHHLFQPLLYQVATAGLSPADIASPIRSVLRDAANVRVVLGEVTAVDLRERHVVLGQGDVLAFDHLVLALGLRTNYFGRPDWAKLAVGLKDLDDALEVRRRLLVAFEDAERSDDEDEVKRLLTFVVIGGGATGVELAGAFAEISRVVLARDFRSIDPTKARVLLVEAGPRLLAGFSEETSASAKRQLEALGVEVRLGTRVTAIDRLHVDLGDERIPTETVVWAAGVCGVPLVDALGVETDRMGRIRVERDCSLPGHPNVFAIGDCAAFSTEEGGSLPGVAPVAIQQASFVARVIQRSMAGDPVRERPAFRYFDKGSMATIGRRAAVAEVGKLRLSGLVAWLGWLFIHLVFLIGFRNRVAVLFSWCWSYLTYSRGARLITGKRLEAGAPPSMRLPPAASLAPPAPPPRDG